jgi:CHC2 zinc finger
MSSRCRKPLTPLPRGWRERLPRGFVYYPKHVNELVVFPSGGGQGKCPLHEDQGTALQVNTHNGRWHCRYCGQGTMVVFHQRLTGMDWNDAVVDLIKTA